MPEHSYKKSSKPGTVHLRTLDRPKVSVKKESPIDPRNEKLRDYNADNNSRAVQFFGGLAAASACTIAGKKVSGDLDKYVTPNRQTFDNELKHQKKHLTSKWALKQHELHENQNNSQEKLGQGLGRSLVEPFVAHVEAHEILDRIAGGKATDQMHMELNHKMHKIIGQEFSDSKQYSGRDLHRVGKGYSIFQSMFSTFGQIDDYGRSMNGEHYPTPEESELVDFAIESSFNLCQGSRMKVPNGVLPEILKVDTETREYEFGEESSCDEFSP